MNWGQKKATEHMKAFPKHFAFGTKDLWTCMDCDVILPITEVTEKSFEKLKHAIKDLQNSTGSPK